MLIMVINEGIIVHKERKKPCYKLGWCPYDDITWSFKQVKRDSKFTCSIFQRHCPVFYISEDVVESSLEKHQKSDKLTEDFTDSFFRSRWFEREKEKFMHNYGAKPCSILNYCPYGELTHALREKDPLIEMTCKLYGKTCPVFYLRCGYSDKKYREDGSCGF